MDSYPKQLFLLTIFSAQPGKPTFIYDLQQCRQQTVSGIYGVKQTGERRDRCDNDGRVKQDCCLIQQEGHQKDRQAGEDDHHQRAVTVIKAIEGKSRAAAQGGAAAAHGLAGCDKTLNQPGDEDGAQAQAVANPLAEIALVAAAAQCAPGIVDPSCLRFDARHHTQKKGQEQTQTRRQAAKEIDHLVRRKNGVHTAQPHQYRCGGDADGQAAQQRFQRHGIADEILPQHRKAEMVITSVPQRKKRGEGQQGEGKDQPLPAAQLGQAAHGAAKGQRQIDRMPETNAAQDH